MSKKQNDGTHNDNQTCLGFGKNHFDTFWSGGCFVLLTNVT